MMICPKCGMYMKPFSEKKEKTIVVMCEFCDWKKEYKIKEK